MTALDAGSLQTLTFAASGLHLIYPPSVFTDLHKLSANEKRLIERGGGGGGGSKVFYWMDLKGSLPLLPS